MNTTELEPYKSEFLRDISYRYSGCHGYISLTVCAIGIPLNIFNITVLTRKKMQTPINCILTWLAVSDMATMISYVPFALHFYIQYSFYEELSPSKNSKAWMNFLVVYLNFSATTHTISIWLGVALAIFRHRHIQSPAKGNLTRVRRLIRARLVVFVIYALSVLLMIPHYVSYRLAPYRNSTMYIFESWNLGTADVKPIVLVSLFTYSIVAKLVPCVLIIVYGGLLLRTLNNTMKHKRQRLSSNTSSFSHQRSIDTSRTTVMLLIVIVLFLVTEMPQGILILCCIFLRKFFENVYIPLGDFMDIIALINSSINFVLYCTMSQEFRKTFIELFYTFSSNRELQKTHVTVDVSSDNMSTSLLKLRQMPERESGACLTPLPSHKEQLIAV